MNARHIFANIKAIEEPKDRHLVMHPFTPAATPPAPLTPAKPAKG